MNVTNAKNFTFDKANSFLLVGQTGTGKSVLERKLIDNYISAHKPSELRFVFLDMTGTDFLYIRDCHNEYIDTLIQFDAEKGLMALDDLAELSQKRISDKITKPLIFICLEECDMSCRNQNRFDNAVITINNNAKKANIKLIYSTSRIGPATISQRLLKSLDLLLVGQMANEQNYKYLGIPTEIGLNRYDFAVIANKSNDLIKP
jgi:DNA segregation ATPase FtsK/SpoIIIE-like protein